MKANVLRKHVMRISFLTILAFAAMFFTAGSAMASPGPTRSLGTRLEIHHQHHRCQALVYHHVHERVQVHWVLLSHGTKGNYQRLVEPASNSVSSSSQGGTGTRPVLTGLGDPPSRWSSSGACRHPGEVQARRSPTLTRAMCSPCRPESVHDLPSVGGAGVPPAGVLSQRVSKRYGASPVLRSVSFEAPVGEVTLLAAATEPARRRGSASRSEWPGQATDGFATDQPHQ